MAFAGGEQEGEAGEPGLPVGVLATLGLLLALAYALSLHAPCDDAYIFLVYVKNWLAGAGPTFNGARVEGFTSPLWVALLSVLGLSGLPLPMLAEGLSTLLGGVALWATVRLARQVGLSPTLSLLPAGLLAATGDFAFYATSGLETSLFVVLVAVCTTQSLPTADREYEPRRGLLLPAAFAALVLTRPDGALVAGFLLVALWITNGSLALSIRCGLVLTALLAPVFVGKWLYYGYWLPNTYHAKSGVGFANLPQGVAYLARAIPRYAAAGLGIAAAFAIARHRAVLPEGFRDRLALFLVPPVWFLYLMVQGGDNMVGGRVIVPMLPLLYTAGVWLASRLPVRQVAGAALAVAAVGALVYGLDPQIQRQSEGWRTSFTARRALGLHLNEHFPPDALVAVSPAGIIPFFSERPTIDMLGLNDVHIAHEGRRDTTLRYAHQSGDGPYVLSRRPDVILFGSGEREPNRGLSVQEIWAAPSFHEDYALEEWPGAGYAYVRKDHAATH